jgi:membrane-associated phospholipid phosphatase
MTRQQASVLDNTGQAGPLLKEVGHRVLRRVLPPALGIFVVVALVGWLLTRPLMELVAGEIAINQGLQTQRSPLWDSVSQVASMIGDTEYIILASAVLLVALRLVFHRWRESAVIVVAALIQLAVFNLTTLLINRPRPDVVKLDQAPPTSSFPSGHVSAAAAVYVGLALILAWHARSTATRIALVAAFLLVPLAVAVARLYRGMHFFTDVAVGLISGLACMVVVAYAFFADARDSRPDHTGVQASSKSGRGGRSNRLSEPP